MNLFRPDYEKPGPGMDDNEPRKTGLARFAELLDRDFFSFFKAGLLALITLVPLIAGGLFAAWTRALIPMVLAGILGGIVAAPQFTALCDTILRSLRDEAGYWWLTYQEAWKKGVKASVPVGILFGSLFSAQLFAWSGMETPEVGHLLLLILGVLISSALAVYVFAQIPLMELSVYAMLRNAILLVLGHFARSVAAVFVIVLYALLMWYFFPYSLPLLLLGGAWFPLLFALMLVYSGLDEAFDIEERIQSLHDGQRESRL